MKRPFVIDTVTNHKTNEKMQKLQISPRNEVVITPVCKTQTLILPQSSNERIINVHIDKLIEHPFAKEIYQLNDLELIEKFIREEGLLDPIIGCQADSDQYHIISGRRRVHALRNIGYDEVPVRIIDIPVEDIPSKIIAANSSRRKSISETIAEAMWALNLIGKSQGQRNDLLRDVDGVNNFGIIGRDRFQRACEMIGTKMSPSTLRRLINVVDWEAEEDNKKYQLVEKIVTEEITISKAESIVKTFKKNREEIAAARNFLPSFIQGLPEPRLFNRSSADMSGEIQDKTIQLVFGSIPYWDLRGYSTDNSNDIQWGHEKTHQEYIDKTVENMRDIWRVLKDDGSFFLNIGATYSKDHNYLIPHRLLLRLCDELGWHCVSEIVWVKKNTLPHKKPKGLQPNYELLYHFTKGSTYKYKPLKIWDSKKTQMTMNTVTRHEKTGRIRKTIGISNPYSLFTDFIEEQKFEDIIIGANAGPDQVRLKKIDGQINHPAIFPSYLALLAILTTTDQGDIILDPWSGSGTTGETSILMNRAFVGYDVSSEYISLAQKRLINAQHNVHTIELNNVETSVRIAA
jgi:DNA modification methylase